MEPPIRCLSFWQPWASLVVHGLKGWETRPKRMIPPGRLLIHAAKTKIGFEVFNTNLLRARSWPPYPCEHYPFGAIIGEVEVLGEMLLTEHAIHGNRISKKEEKLGDYSTGRYCCKLVNPIAYQHPIPYAGKQGIFYVPVSALPGTYRIS